MDLGKVAVLGLGPIGQNIILNLLDDGFDIFCYSIYKKERISFKKGNLWKGYNACALRAILVNGISFTVYENVKNI